MITAAGAGLVSGQIGAVTLASLVSVSGAGWHWISPGAESRGVGRVEPFRWIQQRRKDTAQCRHEIVDFWFRSPLSLVLDHLAVDPGGREGAADRRELPS